MSIGELPMPDEEKDKNVNQSIIDQIEIDLPSDMDMQALDNARKKEIGEWKDKNYFNYFNATHMAILSAGATSSCKFYSLEPNDKDKYGIVHYYFNEKSTDEISTNWLSQYRRDFFIRPVLNFGNLEQLFNNLPFRRVDDEGKKLDYSLLELGWAPRYTTKGALDHILNSQYKKHQLHKTNETFTFDKTYFVKEKEKFKPLIYPVYEFEGKKYIRYRVFQCIDYRDIIDKIMCSKSSSSIICDSNRYRNDDYVWIEITKIPWIVDIKRKRLIAKEGLLSGIQFNNYQKNPAPVDYQKSNIKWFLDNHMKHEILQNELLLIDKKAIDSKKITEDRKTFSDEITSILDKIHTYQKYYFGEIDINKKIDNLLNQYNSSLNELALNIGHERTSLSIGPTNPKILFQKLKANLEDILLELKTNCEKIKNYYDIIDILYECNQETIDSNKDEICGIIATIKEIIDKFITNSNAKDKLIKELNEIIAKNIKRNKAYIEEFKHNDNIKVQSLDELKLDFRRDIHPFLENRLRRTIINQDVVNEIMDNVQIMIDNHFTESKNKMVRNYLNILNQIISKIKEIGNEEDKNKIKEIVKLDFDPTDDINEIIKNLELMIIKSYKVQFDIVERINKSNEIESYRYHGQTK